MVRAIRIEKRWTKTSPPVRSAAAQLRIGLSTEQFARLMDAYLAPSVFADVEAALDELPGIPLAILSNSPMMLDAAIRGNRLEDQFEHVISVDQIKTYKPSPKVYELGVKALGRSAEKILFVSSNAWGNGGTREAQGGI